MSGNQRRNLGCGGVLVAILLLCAVVFVLPNLFQRGDDSAGGGILDGDGGAVEGDVPTAVLEDPTQPGLLDRQSSGQVELGNLIVASDIDRDGCPVDSVSLLNSPTEFYVVAPETSVPEGTTIFARLYRDGEPIEDVPQIVADRLYDDTCISFVFETVDALAFQEGQYEVEFYVNGNPYGPVEFTIQ